MAQSNQPTSNDVPSRRRVILAAGIIKLNSWQKNCFISIHSSTPFHSGVGGRSSSDNLLENLGLVTTNDI